MNIPTRKRKSYALSIAHHLNTVRDCRKFIFGVQVSHDATPMNYCYWRRYGWMEILDLIWNEAITWLKAFLGWCLGLHVDGTWIVLRSIWTSFPFMWTLRYSRTRHVCLRNCRNPSVHRQAPSKHPLLATRIEQCSSFKQSLPKSWAEEKEEIVEWNVRGWRRSVAFCLLSVVFYSW